MLRSIGKTVQEILGFSPKKEKKGYRGKDYSRNIVDTACSVMSAVDCK